MPVADIKSEEDYTKVINDKDITVLHFWADFAQECGTMTDVMTELSKDPSLSNVKYYKLAADEMPELSMKHEIVAVPTLLLFRAGKAIDRIDGANAAELTKKVKSHSVAKEISLNMSRAVGLLNVTRSTLGSRAVIQVGGRLDFSAKKHENAVLPALNWSTSFVPHTAVPARPYSSEAATGITLPETLDYDELKFHLDNDEVLLIDVRNPEELEEDGEIDEAMSVPLGDLQAALAMSPEMVYGEYGLHHHGLLEPSTPIVFTCLLGKRSGMACNIAVEAGYTNVSNFTGGWREWSSRQS